MCSGVVTGALKEVVMRRRTTLLIAAAVTGMAVTAASSATAAPAHPVRQPETSARYEVYDVRTSTQRNAIARTGAAIDDQEHAVLTVTATPDEVRALRALGFPVQPV